MTSLSVALEHTRCVVSVMGSHAGDDAEAIFSRSPSARPITPRAKA